MSWKKLVRHTCYYAIYFSHSRIITTQVRIYLKSKSLGEAIAKALDKRGETQETAAKVLKTSQGRISHLLAGDFRTKRGLVLKLCEYANIDPDRYLVSPGATHRVDQQAIDALARACGGQKHKTEAVIR